MEYVVEMGSVAMIYIPNFIKTGSGTQRLFGGVDSQTHRHTESNYYLRQNIQYLLYSCCASSLYASDEYVRN
jgi:hypothetical protein